MRTLTGRSIQYHILGPVLDLEGTSQIQYSLISQSRRKQRTQIIAYPESCPSGNSNLPPRYMESTFKRGGGGIRLSADTEELGFEIITQENEIINDILHILKQ